jgi:hypothetical protein
LLEFGRAKLGGMLCELALEFNTLLRLQHWRRRMQRLEELEAQTAAMAAELAVLRAELDQAKQADSVADLQPSW